jgi:AraC-like DNA-binding protein
MFLRHYKPNPELQDFISDIVIVHYEFATDTTPPTNPFPPHPGQSLYFYPHDRVIRSEPGKYDAERVARSIFVGPMLSRIDLTLGHNTTVIIVRFHPGGMYRLLHIPMREFFGEAVESSLIYGGEIEAINEQLCEAGDFYRMNEIIQNYLLNKRPGLKRSLPLEQVIQQRLRKGQFISVDQLAKEACISIRQLERQCNERLGLPPKLFFKLVRFSKAWVMRESDTSSSWLHIAHSCGYADQMHLIRDFKFFTNTTPGMLQNDLEKSPLRFQASSLIEEI